LPEEAISVASGGDVKTAGESDDRVGQKLHPSLPKPALLNSIPITQNEKPQLEMLAAQRALYWKAKRWVGFQVICTTVVCLAITAFGEGFELLRPYAALAGFTILFFDTWAFEFLQRGLRRRAAKIQELFDCNVLKLKWNDFLVGSCPDAEEIIDYDQKYIKHDPKYSKLVDWYSPDVGNLPLCFARLVCQRSNIRWDSRLRRVYAGAALGLAGVSLTALIVVQRFSHASFNDFLLALASLSPILLWGVREFAKQRESAEDLDRLKERLKQTWDRIREERPTEDECEREARDLQGALFEHRSGSPVVLDFIYRLFLRKSEEEMGLTAQKMIEEVEQLLPAKDNRARQRRQ
jgi:hypothetical protein